MKTGLLEEIRQQGFWRVNFRPLRSDNEQLRLSDCRELVEKSRVAIRGWDFPHISYPRNDDPEIGGYANAGDHVENWTDWSGFKEFWRMYRSTQFLSYIALREDTMRHSYGNGNFPILDVVSTIHSITEFFEFAGRLTTNGLYKSGLDVLITLNGTQGRNLSAGANRFPFLDAHTTTAQKVEFKRSLKSNQMVLDDYRSVSVDACIEFFDQFGWKPTRNQIENDQERFYQRTIY